VSTEASSLPFAMRTTFQDLILFTFRVDPADLVSFLPHPIRPRIVNGHAYVSIVIASMRGMRPGGVPEPLGIHAYQVVYRALVEADTDSPAHPGVFFLRSDCNDSVLSLLGNAMSNFRFHYFRTSAMGLYRSGDRLLVSVESEDKAGDLVALFRDAGPSELHAPAAPFGSLHEEHAALVELFNAYAVDSAAQAVLDMRIQRGEWKTRRLEVVDWFSGFFGEDGPGRLRGVPVSALAIQECEYLWLPAKRWPMGIGSST
jgi:uncharacterized protein YqjF (DUF2071 family)